MISPSVGRFQENIYISSEQNIHILGGYFLRG
jgi:hypothetical protein